MQERERADAELKASHKRFENLTRGPRAQSLLARAAAALSLPDDSPAASSRWVLRLKQRKFSPLFAECQGQATNAYRCVCPLRTPIPGHAY